MICTNQSKQSQEERRQDSLYIQVQEKEQVQVFHGQMCENWISIFEENQGSKFKNKTKLQQEGWQAEEDKYESIRWTYYKSRWKGTVIKADDNEE